MDGKRVRVGQANNVYIFPGVGLGCMLAGVRVISDSLFRAAAEALAAAVTAEEIASGGLFPPVAELRSVAARVAAAVVREASATGAGDPIPDSEVERRIKAAMWTPDYPRLVRPE